MRLTLETCLACHEVALVDLLDFHEAMQLCEAGQFAFLVEPSNTWELRWCRSCGAVVGVNWCTIEVNDQARNALAQLKKARLT